jgi:tRNA threonylcarbamoyladenosine biosynthesis protein TsaE
MRIAKSLRPGSVIALRGGLGAGKTCFTTGIARALGIEETVTSPTYTIISEYEGILPSFGKLPFYHIDAYRLSGDDDFAASGGEELLESGGISVVEWSERIPRSIPRNSCIIDIEIAGGNNRIFHISEELL